MVEKFAILKTKLQDEKKKKEPTKKLKKKNKQTTNTRKMKITLSFIIKLLKINVKEKILK